MATLYGNEYHSYASRLRLPTLGMPAVVTPKVEKRNTRPSHVAESLASASTMLSEDNRPAEFLSADNLNDELEADLSIKEATAREREWWTTGNHFEIDPSRYSKTVCSFIASSYCRLNLVCLARLPLRLATNVTHAEYLRRCELRKTGRFWDFLAGDVIVIELPTAVHEVAYRAYEGQFWEQFRNLPRQDRIICTGAESMYLKFLRVF